MKPINDTTVTLRAVKAHPDDADRITLRASDLQELVTGGRGADPYEALRESIQGATAACTILAGDAVAAIAGYRVAENEVYVWAASSDLVEPHIHEFLALADKAVKELRLQHPGKLLGNYIDRANMPARRFIKTLGFLWTTPPGFDPFDFFYYPMGSDHVS